MKNSFRKCILYKNARSLDITDDYSNQFKCYRSHYYGSSSQNSHLSQGLKLEIISQVSDPKMILKLLLK